MVGIIDYNMGNIQSVFNALEYINIPVNIIHNPVELAMVDRIILPGVGAFGEGMENLRKLEFIDALNEEVMLKKKPFLGICLGMQLICRESFEFGHHSGLGWIDAEVCRFDPALKIHIPHVGWNNITLKRKNRLIKDMGGESDVYFVHSYFVKVSDAHDVVATCHYGQDFCAMLEKDNIFAAQFHPEKSQQVGLEILKNFSEV